MLDSLCFKSNAAVRSSTPWKCLPSISHADVEAFIYITLGLTLNISSVIALILMWAILTLVDICASQFLETQLFMSVGNKTKFVNQLGILGRIVLVCTKKFSLGCRFNATLSEQSNTVSRKGCLISPLIEKNPDFYRDLNSSLTMHEP